MYKGLALHPGTMFKLATKDFQRACHEDPPNWLGTLTQNTSYAFYPGGVFFLKCS